MVRYFGVIACWLVTWVFLVSFVATEYIVVGTPGDFQQAKVYCADRGMKVAEILTDAELLAAQALTTPGTQYWIDLGRDKPGEIICTNYDTFNVPYDCVCLDCKQRRTNCPACLQYMSLLKWGSGIPLTETKLFGDANTTDRKLSNFLKTYFHPNNPSVYTDFNTDGEIDQEYCGGFIDGQLNDMYCNATYLPVLCQTIPPSPPPTTLPPTVTPTTLPPTKTTSPTTVSPTTELPTTAPKLVSRFDSLLKSQVCSGNNSLCTIEGDELIINVMNNIEISGNLTVFDSKVRIASEHTITVEGCYNVIGNVSVHLSGDNLHNGNQITIANFHCTNQGPHTIIVDDGDECIDTNGYEKYDAHKLSVLLQSFPTCDRQVSVVIIIVVVVALILVLAGVISIALYAFLKDRKFDKHIQKLSVVSEGKTKPRC
mmetsp:Transcript_20122/g.22388  ORF Transcript_20122/g.22388 Transcript_20122/m.22388 type:complete len:427 (+) Transcript_20122:246-1526(+)